MMQRMGGADAFMLALETPRAYMHTFKIAILDPGDRGAEWFYQRYRERSRRRVHRVPVLRWRYLPSPFGLSHPVWAEDPNFNLDYHIRRVACPAPGDQRALCDFMSSVYAYQLDRSRPLWITWVVEGLEGGKVALVTLVHHACFDGAGASNAMLAFFNDTPDEGYDPEPPEWRPGKLPSWPRRLVAGAVELPGMLIRGIPSAIKGLKKKRRLEEATRAAGKPPAPTPSQMPGTPLNRVLSHGRTFVCDSMPLSMLQRGRVGPGTTINDVFLACCAGALRRLLKDMGHEPDKPLIAGIPLAGKRPPGMELHGNFATADYAWLHVDIEDPIERLQACHDSAVEMKKHVEASLGADISSLVQLAPQWLTRMLSWAIRRQEGRVGLFGNVCLSNVPGPREPLYLGSTEVVNWFSTGQVFDGSSLNITMWSYCGRANLCVLADKQIMPDGWQLYDYFFEELQRLIAIAGAPPESHADESA